MISDWDVHRVPVIDGSGELVSLLSQSRITQFLSQHMLKFPIVNKSIGELSLGLRPHIICVKATDLTVSAFHAMRKNRVSGVGVVDDSGALIGVLSVTDLRSVGYDDQLFRRLYTTVGDFIATAQNANAAKPRTVITVKLNNSVAQVFELFNKYGIHRLYVVDAENRPIGVISLGDLLKLFA